MSIRLEDFALPETFLFFEDNQEMESYISNQLGNYRSMIEYELHMKAKDQICNFDGKEFDWVIVKTENSFFYFPDANDFVTNGGGWPNSRRYESNHLG